MTDKITTDSVHGYLVSLFAKAGKPSKKYMTDEERFGYLVRTGAQNFKRKALGLCGRSTVKSLDEIAELLVETKIAKNLEEARGIVPKIVEASKLREGAIHYNGIGFMLFEEVKSDNSPQVHYRIAAYIGKT
ncbi:MAG: hypothetical protein AABX85_04660 [Nanoarchaeota archaeon]